MQLYAIADAYQKVLALAEESGDDEWSGALSDIQDSLEGKVVNLCKLIRTLESDAEAADVEAKRLAAMASSRRNRAKDLKRYLQENLEAIGQQEVKTALFKVKVMQSPPSCQVVDEALVPVDWKRHIPERYEVDARRIIENWRETSETPPGVVIQQSRHLRIY